MIRRIFLQNYVRTNLILNESNFLGSRENIQRMKIEESFAENL